MKWLDELKRTTESQRYDEHVVSYEDMLRLIAIAERAELGGKAWPTQFSAVGACPICQRYKEWHKVDGEYKQVQHIDTCPYSDEWTAENPNGKGYNL